VGARGATAATSPSDTANGLANVAVVGRPLPQDSPNPMTAYLSAEGVGVAACPVHSTKILFRQTFESAWSGQPTLTDQSLSTLTTFTPGTSASTQL
jgi:hypothetical protein